MKKRVRRSRAEKEKLHMARFLFITVSTSSIPQPSLSLLSWHLSIKLPLMLQPEFQKLVSQGVRQPKYATQQRRRLTIKCPVELSQGLQSVPALGIPPRRLSSTNDSHFASLTGHCSGQASQWAPMPPTLSVFNNSSRPNIPFSETHFLE